MKVVGEFNKGDYTLTVYDDEGRVVCLEKHVQTNKFGIECVEGNFESEEDICDALYQALDTLRDAGLDLMQGLRDQDKQ